MAGEPATYSDADLDEILADKNKRIADLEALLRDIDRKIVFETAIMDGTGRDLQERVEAALRIGRGK